MELIIHELITTLKQEITTPSRNVLVNAVRPHLFRFGNPAGSLKLEILDEDSRKITESTSVLISDLKQTTSLDFFHGIIKFDVSFSLKEDQIYHLQLVPTGYTFASSDWVGWVNAFDLLRNEASYADATSINASLGYEIWERKRQTRGRV